MKDPRLLKKHGAWYSYILDSIDSSDYNVELTDDKSRIEFFLKCFNEEYNFDYNRHNYPCLSVRIGKYLRCLPSCIHIALYYDDIIRLSKQFDGYKSKKKEAYYCSNWQEIIGEYIVSLALRLGINIGPYIH